MFVWRSILHLQKKIVPRKRQFWRSAEEIVWNPMMWTTLMMLLDPTTRMMEIFKEKLEWIINRMNSKTGTSLATSWTRMLRTLCQKAPGASVWLNNVWMICSNMWTDIQILLFIDKTLLVLSALPSVRGFARFDRFCEICLNVYGVLWYPQNINLLILCQYFSVYFWNLDGLYVVKCKHRRPCCERDRIKLYFGYWVKMR